MGTASINLNGETITYEALTTAYVRRTKTQTPGLTTRQFQIVANAGAIVYFILNQLEEGSFVSSPIPVAGASATPS